MYFEVSMYGSTGQQFATVVVEADSLNDAHALAIKFMNEQNGDINPS